MYHAAYETGNILNGLSSFIGTNAFMVLIQTCVYIATITLGLFLPGAMGKAVYCKVKDK